MKILFSRNIFFILVFFVAIFVKQSYSADQQLKKKIEKHENKIKKNITKSVSVNKKNSFYDVKKTINSIIDELEKTLSKDNLKLDKNQQETTIKDTENKLLETYAGMVGDKRASKGITLDLTMETQGNGYWLLCINGKGVGDKKLVSYDFQQDKAYFFINVNTSTLQDKVVNFTYQMPRNIRLKYGKQKKGYRITIGMPSGTKIINKNTSTEEISIKFVNYEIINFFKKEIEEKNKKTNKQQNNNIDKLGKKNDVFIFDSKYHGLLEIEKNTVFQKLKIKHKKPLIVAIDAGHGGIDPGAKSTRGIYEKNITLKYAKNLQKELKKRNINVVMIRTNDKTIPLTNRVKIAKQAKADLFVSLHTDAHCNPKISGTTVYRLSDLNDSHPDWRRFYNKNYLPKQYENYISNHHVLDILVSMTHQTLSEKSSIIVDNILLLFKKNGVCNVCRKGQRSFAVLRGLDMMSILIEIGYISNPKEEKKLLKESNIKKFSVNLADIIDKTFN